MSDDGWCTTCGVPPEEPCRTARGEIRRDHLSRRAAQPVVGECLIRISEDNMMEMTPTQWDVRVGRTTGVLTAPVPHRDYWYLTWTSEHEEGSTGGVMMSGALTRTSATERTRRILHALETRRMGLEAPGTADAIIKASTR